MRKHTAIIITILLTTTIMLSGCQEEQKATTTDEKNGEIVLDSDVVELVDSKYKVNKRIVRDDVTEEKMQVVRNVEISFLFRNIADRDIKISVEAEFYDSNDKLVGIAQGASEIYLPKDYTEKATNTPTNTIIYDGKNKEDVVKAVIVVNEI
jgi:hypothetical protein